MICTLPDPAWYLDNVVVPGDIDHSTVGPARRRELAWLRAAERVLSESAGTPDLHSAVRVALRQGFVLTRPDARTAGLDEPAVRRLLRSGQWSIPRRGVYCILSALPEQPRDARTRPDPPNGNSHEIRAAAVARVRPGTVISHESVAALRGLPLIETPTRPVLSAVSDDATCGRRDARVHIAPLAPEDLGLWFGVTVTTPARTAIDVARTQSAGAGLAIADAALHEQLTTRAALDRAARLAEGRRGAAAARLVARLASPLPESALESLARLCLHQGGVPAPRLQAWVSTDSGLYRVDGLWPDRRVVLEVDGNLKYRMRPGALVAEKRRQEALERAGYLIVRVSWDDVLRHPDETVARVLYALRRGGRGVPGSW